MIVLFYLNSTSAYVLYMSSEVRAQVRAMRDGVGIWVSSRCPAHRCGAVLTGAVRCHRRGAVLTGAEWCSTVRCGARRRPNIATLPPTPLPPLPFHHPIWIHLLDHPPRFPHLIATHRASSFSPTTILPGKVLNISHRCSSALSPSRKKAPTRNCSIKAEPLRYMISSGPR